MSYNKMDDFLPKENKNDESEEIAVEEFKIQIRKGGFFHVQNSDSKDYGKDLEIEVRNKGSRTNLRIHVQVKGTEKDLNKADDSLSYKLEKTNINYLLRNEDSILVCYHIPSKTLFVESISEVYDELLDKHKDIKNFPEEPTIRLSKVFDYNHQEKLSNFVIKKYDNKIKRKNLFFKNSGDINKLIKVENFNIDVNSNSKKALVQLESLIKGKKEYIVRKHYEEFKAVFKNSEEEKKGTYFLHVAKINIGLSYGDFTEGEINDAIIDIKSLGKSNCHFKYNIANAYLILGDLGNAKMFYEETINESKESKLKACCYKNMSQCFLNENELNKRISFLEKSIELDEGLNEALFDLSVICITNRMDKKGLYYLDKIISDNEIDNNRILYHYWTSIACFNIGDLESSYRELKYIYFCVSDNEVSMNYILRLISHYLQNCKNLYFLGKIYRLLKISSKKKDCKELEELKFYLRFKILISKDGLSYSSFLNYKNLFSKKIKFNSQFYLSYLKDVVYSYMFFNENVEAYLTAKKIAYNMKSNINQYISILYDLDKFNEVVMNCLNVKDDESDYYTNYIMGMSLFEMGNYNEAIKCFEKSIEKNNFHLSSWYNLFISYINIEEEEASEKVLKDISRLFYIKDYSYNSEEFMLLSNIEKIKTKIEYLK